MAKRKTTKKEFSNGKLLVYLFIIIAAVFIISKFDITGKAVDVEITPLVNAGDNLYLDIDTGNNLVKPEYDIYKHSEKNARRLIQGYGEICRASKCIGEFKLKVKSLDSWKTGKYSVRVYNWRSNRGDYTEVFFNVVGVYPGTDEIDEYPVHV